TQPKRWHPESFVLATRAAATRQPHRFHCLSIEVLKNQADSSHAHVASADAKTEATCTALRRAPSSIWCRQLVPSATINASFGALRTAGNKLRSAIRIEIS